MAPRTTPYCPSCNMTVDPSATFCNHCGRALPTQFLPTSRTPASQWSLHFLVITVVTLGIMIGIVGVIWSRSTRDTIQGESLQTSTPSIASIIPTLTPDGRIFNVISHANHVYPYAGGIDNPYALNMDHNPLSGGFTQRDHYGHPLPTATTPPSGVSRLTINNKDDLISYRLNYDLPSTYPGYAGFSLQFDTDQDISKYKFLVIELEFKDKNTTCGLFLEDGTGNKGEILSGLGVIYSDGISVTTTGNRQIITINLRNNYKNISKEMIRQIGFEIRTEFSNGSGWFEVYRVELVHE